MRRETDTSDRLRAAVIGIGSMGWNHARILSEATDADLIGVVDFDAERRQRAQTQFGCPTYDAVDALLADKPDFVVVATPNHHHASIGIECLAAGAHVLVEKPIAGTLEEAQALIEVAKSHNRKLMVGQVERFNPAVQAVKAATTGQTIRTIQIVRVGPFPPRMSNVGVIIDLGVHDIDIIRTVAQSEIVDVQAQISATRSAREDTALMQFRTENNVIAQVSTNWITPFKARRLEVATDQRYIIADLMTRQVTEYYDYEESGSYRARQVFVKPGEPLKEELSAFMHAIRTDTTPAVTGEDGLRNLEIALRCLATGSRPDASA